MIVFKDLDPMLGLVLTDLHVGELLDYCGCSMCMCCSTTHGVTYVYQRFTWTSHCFAVLFQRVITVC